MNSTVLLRKLRVGRDVLRQRGVAGVSRELLRKLVRVTEQRVDRLDLVDRPAVDLDDPANAWLSCHLATPEDLVRLFADWRDPDVEYQRHHRVCHELGFQRVVLGVDRATGRVAHFQIALLPEDREHVWRVLRSPAHRRYFGPHDAWQGWVYTFTDFRQRGASVLVTEWLARYCLERGVTTLYSRRGATNTASMRMADRLGYTPVARVYHVQFLNQHGNRGLSLVRPLRKSQQDRAR